MPRTHICLCLLRVFLVFLPSVHTKKKDNNKLKCFFSTVQHVHTGLCFFIIIICSRVKPKTHVRRTSIKFVACRNCENRMWSATMETFNLTLNCLLAQPVSIRGIVMSQKPLLPWLPECFSLISWHLVMITISPAEDQSWQISSADRRELGSGRTSVYPRPACVFWCVFFFSSCCCCATLHLRTFKHLLDLFLTSDLLFDLLFFFRAALVCNVPTLAQVDSSQFIGFLGSCLVEITVFFKAVIKMAWTPWKRLACSPKEQSLNAEKSSQAFTCFASQQSVNVSFSPLIQLLNMLPNKVFGSAGTDENLFKSIN